MHEEVLTDSYGRQGTIFLAVTQHLHMTGAIPLLVPSLLGTLCCGSGSLCCGYPVVGVRPKYIWRTRGTLGLGRDICVLLSPPSQAHDGA